MTTTTMTTKRHTTMKLNIIPSRLRLFVVARKTVVVVLVAILFGCCFVVDAFTVTPKLLSIQKISSSSLSTTTTTTTTTTNSNDDKNVHYNNDEMMLLGTAMVDYSAASEYVKVHYGIPNYFGTTTASTVPTNKNGNDDDDNDNNNNNDENIVIRKEQVFDARYGILHFSQNDNNSNNNQNNKIMNKENKNYNNSADASKDTDQTTMHHQQQQQQRFSIQPATLLETGFELISSCPTNVTDFSNMTQVSCQYLQELKQIVLPKAINAKTKIEEENGNNNNNDDDDNIIDSIIFWHPMLRGEGRSIQPRSQDHPSQAGIASMVHMDTDVGAYGLDGILNLVRKNRVIESSLLSLMDDNDGEHDDQDNDEEEEQKDRYWKMLRNRLIQERKRFLLLNIWRPVERPVTSAPLGIWAVQYNDANDNNHNDNSSNKDPSFQYFPKATPCLQSSRWYTFSNMQPNECLIFKQYDRNAEYLSDFWHCALDIQQPSSSTTATMPSSLVESNNQHNATNMQNIYPRKSFDIKAMVILKEQVPPNKDRHAMTNKNNNNDDDDGDIPSLLLSLQESGEFCNEQSRKLKARRRSQKMN